MSSGDLSGKSLVAETGKNLLIEVPDWDSTAPGLQSSYLRLGKFAAEDMDPDDEVRGGKLVSYVAQVGPSDGWEDASPGPRVFEDDWRTRPPGSLAEAARKTRSAALTGTGKAGTKPSAGWRDHTNGDRITTTQGDKLEVIGGNYKLVVLGRTGDPGQAAGLDLSGGLIQDFDAAPGTINEIRWVQDQYDGTWKIFEKTEKGIVHALYHGDVTEEYYGKRYTTIVGSPSAAQHSTVSPDARAMMATTEVENPTIVEKVWAKEISSSTTADKLTDTVHAKTLTETVDVTENWTVTTTSGGVWLDKATAETVKRELWGTSVFDLLAAKAMVGEIVMAPVHAQIDLSVLNLSLATGAALEVAIGGKIEILLGYFKTIKLLDVEDTVLVKKSDTSVSQQSVAATSSSTAGTATIAAGVLNVPTASASIGPAPTPPPRPPTPPPANPLNNLLAII